MLGWIQAYLEQYGVPVSSSLQLSYLVLMLGIVAVVTVSNGITKAILLRAVRV